MKFGQLPRQGTFELHNPETPTRSLQTLMEYGRQDHFRIHVGAPAWSRNELPGFYPPGTSDELSYYASQFNAVELNATFYRIFPKEQFIKWGQKTPSDFRFYPKIVQQVSHTRRLNDKSYAYLDSFLENSIHLKEKIDCYFLQLPDNYRPEYKDRIKVFLEYWPSYLPLAIEFRHKAWFSDSNVIDWRFEHLKNYNVGTVLTDTPGRPDVLHMDLTSPDIFIRFVATNSDWDRQRIDLWIDRIETWHELGLGSVSFFIHEHREPGSPFLATYLINSLNKSLGLSLKLPEVLF